jgi:hypothetical protein
VIQDSEDYNRKHTNMFYIENSVFENLKSIEAPVFKLSLIKNGHDEKNGVFMIVNCTFVNNNATKSGQASIIYEASSFESVYVLKITNSKFRNNFADCK